jgi:hypothetical protein
MDRAWGLQSSEPVCVCDGKRGVLNAYRKKSHNCFLSLHISAISLRTCVGEAVGVSVGLVVGLVVGGRVGNWFPW